MSYVRTARPHSREDDRSDWREREQIFRDLADRNRDTFERQCVNVPYPQEKHE